MLTPLCTLSGQSAYKACISNFCTIDPFVCKYCHEEECQQLHLHNNEELPKLMRWTDITKLMHLRQIKQGQQVFIQYKEVFTKKMNVLVEEIKRFQQDHLELVLEICNHMFIIEPGIDKTFKLIDTCCYKFLTGKSLGEFYQKVKNNQHISKSNEVEVKYHQEIGGATKVVSEIKEILKKHYQIVENNKKKSKALEELSQAKQHISKENHNQAVNSLNRSILANSESVEAYLARAQCYLKINNESLFQKDCETVIKLDPKNLVASELLGEYYRKNQKQDKALQYYNKLLQANPNNEEVLFKRIEIYYGKNDSKKCMEDCLQMLKINSKRRYVNSYLATAYQNLGKLKQAQEHYTREILINPQHYYSYNNRAKIRKQKNQLKDCIEDLTKCIQLQYKSQDYEQRAIAKLAKKDYADAREDFEIALALNDKMPVSYFHLAMIYLYHNLNKQAKQLLLKSVKLDESNYDACYRLGKLLTSEFEYKEAEKYYTMAIRIDGSRYEAFKGRAETYQKLGNHRNSLIDYRKAIKIKKDDYEMYLGRGKVNYYQQHLDYAIKDLTKAIQLEKNCAEAYKFRSKTHESKGEAEEAKKDEATYQMLIKKK